MRVRLLRRREVEIRAVPAEALGRPDGTDPVALFQAVDLWATGNGWIGGWPTFVVAGSSYSPSQTVVLLREAVAERATVEDAEIGVGPQSSIAEIVVRAQAWARAHGASSAIPVFADPMTGQRIAAVVQIRADRGFERWFKASELGFPHPLDVVSSFRGAHLALDEDDGWGAALPELEIEPGELDQRNAQLNGLLAAGWRIASVHPLSADPGLEDAPGLGVPTLVVVEREAAARK